MKYSLEARVPLGDHRLVEFAYSLPTDIKLKMEQIPLFNRDILLFKGFPRRKLD